MTMSKQEQLDYLVSTGLYENGDLFYPNKMIENENAYVSVSDLVERFIDVDKYFSEQEGKSYTEWNLRQILGNINMLIPCTKEKLVNEVNRNENG